MPRAISYVDKSSAKQYPSDTNQKIAIRLIGRIGFSVAAVWNGKEALEYIQDSQNGRGSKPNLILMDVQMPIMDGYECTHVLRNHSPFKNYVLDVPIIAMTASAIQGDREKCLKAGMDDYLAKPVQTQTLKRMLMHWVSPPSLALLKLSPNSIIDLKVAGCSGCTGDG
jgi:CheY-like chemotaxis protein